MVAVITNTPLPQVWTWSLVTVMRYASKCKDLLPLFNPFAGMDEKDKGETDPDKGLAMLKQMGMR